MASEKKFNKKKVIIVAVIIAVTLTSCAGCNRLSPTELEEVVSDKNSNASATTEISESNSQSETDMTAEGSEAKEETESTTTEAETEKLETPATEQTTPKPSDTTTTKPSETETTAPAETTTTTTTTAATPQSTEAPAPEWTETAVSGTKYVTVDCYSRVKAIVGSKRVKLYKTNTEVKVVARTDTGYFKLENGNFIHGDYLSDSKIVIQTTTTTKKAEAPKPVETKPAFEPFTAYVKSRDVILCLDENFADYIGSLSMAAGSPVTIVGLIEEKDVYEIKVEDYKDLYYAKTSDFTLTNPIPAAYYYPFDFEAIKQDIIAQKDEVGLEYFEDTGEGNTWFVPVVADKNTYPPKLYEDIDGILASHKASDPQMWGFSVRIKPIPYEEYGVYGYPWGCYTREEWEELDSYAIYIIRTSGYKPPEYS